MVKKSKSFIAIYKDFGLQGVLKELEHPSQKASLLKLLLNFDKKHFVVYKFLKDLTHIEKGISRYGPRIQALKFINKLGLRPAVYSDITNRNFQNQKGLLIYGINHNTFVEPIILFSLLNQKNIKLILFRFYYFLGKNIQRYALPVATRNYSSDAKINLIKNFDLSFRFRKAENLTERKTVAINSKSIKEAAKILEGGGIVIIFPGGAGNELKKWGFGISRIILNIAKEKRGEISLLPVYFSGMGGKRMLVRIFKTYKKINQANLRVGVYFGKEKTITSLYSMLGKNISEESILNYLRKDAFSQYGLKEFPFKSYLYPQNYPLALSRSFLFLAKVFIQLAPFRDLFRS